jgi:rhodanese-related sulfurtransferase
MTVSTATDVCPETTGRAVRAALRDRREVAILDVREEGVFAEAHPLFAASLPLGRLEMEVFDRIPRKATPIVVYDDHAGALARSAISWLRALGYTEVSLLRGGLQGWAEDGGELFRDVNSASKAFGELVEATRHTPSLAAEEVRALLDRGTDMVVVDARRLEEYQTMNIPSGMSVPGAELVFRIGAVAPSPETLVVVNCAGRTRSIIGTQSLVNAGIPNRVAALRNGTIGWTLAGLTLERGQQRVGTAPSETQAAAARAAARAVADRARVGRIDAAQYRAWEAAADRTLYRFDVRSPEEYAAGHPDGFRSAPGGQLVQETDVFAPVRGARIVIWDDQSARADMTASWLAQMGWDVHVLEAAATGLTMVHGPWRPTRPEAPAVAPITPEQLSADPALVIVDVAPSPAFIKGHVPGAWFASRTHLDEAVKGLPSAARYVVTSEDGTLARFAAPELAALTGAHVLVLEGGTAAWHAEGRRMAAGLDRAAAPATDVYKRPYEGTDNAVSAMQAYLDWEFGLVAQLERDGTHGFWVL